MVQLWRCSACKRVLPFTTRPTRCQRIARLMERGFAAVAADMADLKRELKGDIAHVQEQVNSIEAELRYGRYEKRLGDLQEKVFGAPRR